MCNIQPVTDSQLVASRDLFPDSIVLTLPQKLLITQKLISKTKIGKALGWAQQRPKLGGLEIDWDDVAVHLYLIQEKYNENSVWAPFLRILLLQYEIAKLLTKFSHRLLKKFEMAEKWSLLYGCAVVSCAGRPTPIF